MNSFTATAMSFAFLVLVSFADAQCASQCFPQKSAALKFCTPKSTTSVKCHVTHCANGGYKCMPDRILASDAFTTTPFAPRPAGGCPDRCLASRDAAWTSCMLRGRPILGCIVKRCGKGKFRCGALPPPIKVKRGCTNICYADRNGARDDCLYNRRSVQGCQVSTCTAGGEEGWVCAPVPGNAVTTS